METLFRNATVIDGTGSERYVANVTVAGTRITSVDQSTNEKEASGHARALAIDATGLVLCPGFIDAHTVSYTHLTLPTKA